eukprot:Gb_23248 [translate_table: standard]
MHQKKSELQIGKESRGFSSDYCRLVQDDFISTPHKRGGSDKTTLYSLMQMKLSQTHQSAMEQHIKSTHSKLTRTPSSLLRSPTIKSGIDSFHSLEEEETADAENYSKTNKLPKRRSYRDDILLHNCKKPPGFRFQLLLPPVVVVVIPCFWYYIRAMQNRGLNSSSDVLVLGLWFDSFSALVFVTAVVISLKIAFPDLKLGFRLPSMRLVRGSTLGQSWGCLAVSWAKPLAAYLSDERHRRKIKGNPSVTWTIGSKPKCERSKIIREGVEVYSNGDVYEGEFHQGKCSGSGVYYYYVNGRYEGDWVDGKYDGYGVETWARGSRYRGQYRQGLRHGYGVYRFYTGDMYAGEWCNGQSHGYGVQTCEDGSRYVGEFKWGVKHGLGYYHFRNGDTYAGEYFADKMHGFGVYNFANGHRYEGAWHEGRKQGLGMYTFRNSETQSGHWHCGVLETHSTQNPQTGLTKGVNHSKVLNAVQEARCAAGKAFEVPRVDDRVNKAIAAANKAATAARVAAVKAVQKRMHGDVPAVDI